MSIFSTIYQRMQKRNPVQFWRSRGAKIGERCDIYASVSFGSEPYLVEVGNHVRMTADVKLITHDGGVWVLRDTDVSLQDIDLFGKITIGNNVHIGIGAVIMPGVSIGSNVIIGCGAIVTKNIPDNSIAVGIPARVIETIDDYKLKHIDDFVHTSHMSAEEKRDFLIERFKQ